MKAILLQWNSKNAGLTVALRSILTFLSEYKIMISDLQLLQNDNFDDLQSAELDIFKNANRTTFEKYQSKWEGKDRERIETVYKQCLELQDRNAKPKLIQKRLHIKSVTDYQSIYNAVREYLKELPTDIPLHINVSPGTPQMHTVWLMLNASGYLPSTVRIWSSQFDKERKKYPLDEVKFKPKTYLNEIFETAYRKTYPIVINPNDTISGKRQEAEENLRLFASIPDVPILLISERGVGKTTYVEQFIKGEHYSNKPFQVLPCGIFSEDLMRSELFGYEKGAFTGANERKEGIFHQFKNGGLLFLDEIHDLSKPLQRQLMQVLQSKEFLPIGSTKKEQTNFRLITATNLDFEELSQQLSLDFLDRIAQYVVEIPPIRDCREDIFRYWETTWKNNSEGTILPKSKALEQFLNTYPFQGNFRDLQRLAHHLFAFSKTKTNEEAINLAIKSVEKWQSKSIKTVSNPYFQHGKSYNKIVNQFNQDLANWAVSAYGSRKVACEHLDMTEAWLSKAINGKSR